LPAGDDDLLMIFSSNLFIFGFMPIFFATYYLTPRAAKNALILLASLFFYAFGAGPIVVVLALSIVVNYAAACAIEVCDGGTRRLIFWLAVAANMSALFYYKYADFAWQAADTVAGGALERIGWAAPQVALPIGISFFTFQALSYIADVYAKHCPAERSIVRFGMYHSLFPQLIAGPIVRYVEIRSEIAVRSISLAEISEGITRFIIGLAKKVIIADHAGQIADAIFGLDAAQLTPATAWLGAIAYGIQILFDFAGYSDMAIGLGRLLGFHFPENFADPYLSRSVTEFWRRWNMTLSRWFRDYVYVPLGGNRKGALRTYVNLVVVFFLCGLWHGAGYTFIVWGLFHGAFLAGERFALHRWALAPRGVLGQIYTLAAVTVGWVLFRSVSLAQAAVFLKEMFFMTSGNPGWTAVPPFLPSDRAFYLLLGIILAVVPMRSFMTVPAASTAGLALQRAAMVMLLIFSAALLSEGTFNPFIYFRF
jgi:alginate O-acetyltransferase complex protein AlgI